MKWVCLMANMMVPGVGSMIAGRYGPGIFQALGSIIAFGMVGYCISEFYTELKNYADSLDGDPDEMTAAMKALGERILGPPIIIGGVGVIILKVTWIWAQFTTAAVFKKEKETEAQDSARPEVSLN